MLIRINGAEEGIKKYLVEGQKSGRSFTRDELDERVILLGDLDVTNGIIESMNNQGDKYLHITLSFKEDLVSNDMLKVIVSEFESFAMSAYKKEEYNIYAEAHLPKIKSYLNKLTGEVIERKPHIHVVIPKINLISNTTLNPFGLVDMNVDYIDAFQEHTNNKYGLISPKDNLRTSFSNASEVISRYKGDVFDGNNKEIKEQILEQILQRKIDSYTDFIDLLSEFGERRTRNAGKPNQYENIKPEGMEKGINLKEPVFSKAFIELSAENKALRLKSDLQVQYQTNGQPKKDIADIPKNLDKWYSSRAKEVKYLNSGSTFYKKYFAADIEERHKLLLMLEDRFYKKYQEVSHEQAKGRHGEYGIDRFGTKGYEFDEYERRNGHPHPADRERLISAAPEGAEAETIDGMRNLPSGDMARDTTKREVLLSHHASIQLGQRTTDGDDALRRTTHRRGTSEAISISSLQPFSAFVPPDFERHAYRSLHNVRKLSDIPSMATLPTSNPLDRVVAGISRKSDSVVGQIVRNFNEQQQIDGNKGEFQQIKQRLDAARLLAHLSSSHGVLVEKYSVVKADDGSDRIKCGNRHLNVSDFLTKEMHLPWSDAQSILRQSYQKQLQKISQPLPQQQPNPILWKAFLQEHVNTGKKGQQEVLQRQSEKERKAAIISAYQAMKSDAMTLPPNERRLARSRAAGMFKEQKMVLDKTIQEERKKSHVPLIEHYRAYLINKAESEPSALVELRRMRKEEHEIRNDEHYISNSSCDDKNEIIVWPKRLAHLIHENGDIGYFVNDREIVVDDGRRLKFMQNDVLSIETGLLLAQQKFGTRIELFGTTEFKEQSAKIAADCEMNLQFTDNRLNAIFETRRAEIFSEKKQYDELVKIAENLQKNVTPEIKKEQIRNVTVNKTDQDREPESE